MYRLHKDNPPILYGSKCGRGSTPSLAQGARGAEAWSTVLLITEFSKESFCTLLQLGLHVLFGCKVCKTGFECEIMRYMSYSAGISSHRRSAVLLFSLLRLCSLLPRYSFGKILLFSFWEFHVASLRYKPDFKVMREGWDGTTRDPDEVHYEISMKEDEMLYQEFVKRMNFNKKKEAPFRRMELHCRKTGLTRKRGGGGGWKFVSLPDGSSRELNEMEKMYVKRETVCHRYMKAESCLPSWPSIGSRIGKNKIGLFSLKGSDYVLMSSDILVTMSWMYVPCISIIMSSIDWEREGKKPTSHSSEEEAAFSLIHRLCSFPPAATSSTPAKVGPVFISGSICSTSTMPAATSLEFHHHRTSSPARSAAPVQLHQDQHQVNKSGIHLSLHHVHGPCSLLTSPSPSSIADILSRDEARVRGLNTRLSNTASSTSKSHHLLPKSLSVPLNPGSAIGTGNYYVKIGLGTPVKYYAMIIDSGSSFTWLQCQPCEVYCHSQVGSTFNPSTSKTHNYMSCSTRECSSLKDATLNDPACSRRNVCIYAASYGDSSYSLGYLSRDTLTLAPSETTPGFVYGCGQDNEGLFGQAAGLIGLGLNKLSMMAQLSSKYGYVFNYCLPTSGSTGWLSIGLSSFKPSLYKFTPMIKDSRDPALYFLRVTGITVAGKALGVSASVYRNPFIIDSGTVITRLPMTIYTALQGAFVKRMGKYPKAPAYSILDTCFKGSAKGMLVPEIGMVFQGGAELMLGGVNSVIEVDAGITCLAFAGSSSSNGIAIIGNRQQETFRVAYDVSNSRIGFAAGGCT
ncbi:hypothetical protein HHK36_024032 [Tetracentron sinense]|uniref:Peptidase A1 domain-containing protein n=1 Tax=Tetracentron sinense TaxID=13715 RepID=A0A835D5Y4_TETSI|nr:hypothetical protein HHK36_024032 [Tetracentron sinense]